MNARERFHATCGFEKTDRPLRRETLGFWPETFARWHGEGLPAAVNDNVFSAPPHFGFDTLCWYPVAADTDNEPGFCPRFEEVLVEETEEYVVKRDAGGSTVRIFRSGRSAIPQVLASPVKTMGDFEEIRWRLDPEHPERFTIIDLLIEASRSVPDFFSGVWVCGLFGMFRHLMGLTGISVALRRDPALVHAVARQWLHLNAVMIKRISEKAPVDFVVFWEDMSYKNGPMLSPAAFREFMLPFYRECIESVRTDTGIRNFCVDSDGNVDLLVPLFLEAGVTMMFPFEVQAGMDVRKVRELYGKRLVIWGGIDKMVLVGNADSIMREVREKVPVMLGSGGYVPSLDHSVPPEVPLKNFELYLEMVREIGLRG